MTSSLPVVDLSLNDSHKLFDEAMTGSGFCVLVNHGVDPSVIDSLFKASREFFLQNTLKDKMKFNHGSYGNPKGGYTRVGTETVARSMEKESSAPPDLCENYVMLGDVLRTADPCENQHHSDLLAAGREYYALMVELMTKVHELSAMAFNKPKDFFVDYYTPPDISLRLSHYPALSGIPEIQPGQIRYGKHTDYTGFTFLCVDNENVEGLQICIDGEWKDVRNIPDGSFIVNIGDMMSVWTSGRWKATLHRVVNPSKSSRSWSNPRFSIPLFTGPRLDAIIRPFEGDDTDGIHAGDWLRRKIAQSNNFEASM